MLYLFIALQIAPTKKPPVKFTEGKTNKHIKFISIEFILNSQVLNLFIRFINFVFIAYKKVML